MHVDRWRWQQWSVALLLILLLVMLVHGPQAQQNFHRAHWEDTLFFTHEQKQIRSWGDCLRYPLWPGLYRPLSTTCYYYAVGQLTAGTLEARLPVHHTINLLLYALNGLLLVGLSRWFFPWPWALLPAALVVTRFAHAEIVRNTVEFQMLAATALMLLTLLFSLRAYQQRSPWALTLSCAALGLALFCKETAAVTPLLLCLHGWLYYRWRNWRWLLAPLGVTGLWAFSFATFLRGLTDFAPTGFAYTFSPPVLLTQAAVYFYSFANRFVPPDESLILPASLAQAATTPLLQLLLVVILGAVAALLLLSRSITISAALAKTLTFGVVFFVIAAAPYLLLADRLFLRYSYFGHFGLAIASIALLQLGWRYGWNWIQRLTLPSRENAAAGLLRNVGFRGSRSEGAPGL